MTIKKQFIEDLIRELNNVNSDRLYYEKKPLDVCYMVSVVDQQLEHCKEFLEDISKNTYYINGYDEDVHGGYTNGRVRILMEKPVDQRESDMMYDSFLDYCYYIEFQYDERYWGYCQCTPEDDEYNEKYRCCGGSCDWVAPSFSIEKVIGMGKYNWGGLKRDYWKYKEIFESNEQNNNEEIERYEKQQKIDSIKNRMEELQKELVELEIG